MSELVYYFTYAKTAFMPFRVLYPECLVLIEDEPRLFPLICMPGPEHGPCHRNKNCASTLAHRVNYLFENVVIDCDALIAYFKYRDRPKRIRAGLFTKNLSTPRVLTVNPYAFKRIQKKSTIYSWSIPSEYLLMRDKSPTIISPESLVRASD
jgi:hypothetical protein